MAKGSTIYPQYIESGASTSGQPAGTDYGQKGIEQGDDKGSISHGSVPSPNNGSVLTGKFSN